MKYTKCYISCNMKFVKNTSTYMSMISYADRVLTSKNGYLSGLLNNKLSKVSLVHIRVNQWCFSFSSTERLNKISEILDLSRVIRNIIFHVIWKSHGRICDERCLWLSNIVLLSISNLYEYKKIIMFSKKIYQCIVNFYLGNCKILWLIYFYLNWNNNLESYPYN